MVIGKVYFYLVNRNSEFYQYKRINEEFTNYRTFNNWIAGCGSTIQNTKCDYYNPRWFRWQEVFTGADSILLNNKNLVKNTKDYKNKYWNSNTAARRKMLMPFLWETIAKNGQIYGNRHIGCNVNVANPYWFSYPGYSEILCGFADKRINSNSYGPNPNVNVLEFINQTQEFNGKVAVFTSWEAFPDILNKNRSRILVNSAFDKVPESESNSQIELLNKMQSQLPDVFYGVRLDALTFNIGFEYLKQKSHACFISHLTKPTNLLMRENTTITSIRQIIPMPLLKNYGNGYKVRKNIRIKRHS